jgi:anionic cell wall polymer biosynthesis LytR-Cps2A-Psr (LCP) family protein
MFKQIQKYFTSRNNLDPNINCYRQFSSFRSGLSWGIIISFTTIVSGTIGAFFTLVTPVNQTITTVLNQTKSNEFLLPKKSVNYVSLDYLNQPVNILFIGIEPLKNSSPQDSYTFIGHSNTILLLQFKPQQNSLQVISIPPDSQVEIPNIGQKQISDANVYGGAKFLTQVVSYTLDNLPIDGYIIVSNVALRELNNWLSKADNFSPQIAAESLPQSSLQNQIYRDALSNLQRQEIFLKKLHHYWHHPESLAQIPEIIASLKKYLDTNLNHSEIIALANFLHQLESEQIKVSMLPEYTKYQPKIGRSSLTMLGNKQSKRITSSATDKKLENVAIAVQNTTDNPELASRMLAFLKKRNFQNVHLINHLPLQLNQTEIIVEQGDMVVANYLKNSLGLGRLILSPAGDLNFELTIRIGEDAKNLILEDGFIRY